MDIRDAIKHIKVAAKQYEAISTLAEVAEDLERQKSELSGHEASAQAKVQEAEELREAAKKSQDKADARVRELTEEGNAILREATQKAQEILSSATTEGQRLIAGATEEADKKRKLAKDYESRSEFLSSEIDKKNKEVEEARKKLHSLKESIHRIATTSSTVREYGDD